ncbi:MAG: hypothetical protein RRZ24_04720 [Clostridia bacterium]
MEEIKLPEQGIAETSSKASEDHMQDSFGTLDYVKELFLQGIEQEKRDRKKLRMLRLCTIFIGIMMVTLVLSAILVGPYFQSAVRDFHAITEKVQEINVQKLTAQIDQFLTDATVSINTVGQAAGKLSELDMKALNDAILELSKTVEIFGKIDIGKMNASIETLYNATEKLSKFKLFG